FYGNYALYFLVDRLHYTLAQVPILQLIGVLVSLVTTTAAAIGGGILSDRLGRRKIFVLVATLFYGVGVVIIAFAPSFVVYMIGGALAGMANGAYASVDMAMTTQVLTKKENTAKELGVMSIATLLPQSLAPAIAPLFLAIGGGNNYTALYLIAGFFFVVGAFAIQPVKSVK
ncbi:MAG TPA: MFS transporter, partial [Ktedonobacteraceae bacterium]|nr:MFS transporter [Ktedonobacteraceae bacterium]